MNHIISNTKIPRLASFLNAIRRDDPVAILYDDDADGACACAILHTYLERFGMRTIHTFAKSSNLFSQTFTQQMKDARVKTLFVLDFEPLSWGMLTTQGLVSYPLNLVVFDHHANMTKNYDHCVSMMQRLYVHPANCTNGQDPAQYCTTKLVFDVLTSLSKLVDIEWKVLPGMISDMNHIAWSSYMQQLLGAYGVQITQKNDWFSNPFGQVSLRLNLCASQGPEALNQALHAFIASTSVQDALTKIPRVAPAEEFSSDFLVNFTKYGTLDPGTNTYFLELPNKQEFPYEIGTSQSSILSFLHDQHVFFILQKVENNMYHIHVRSQRLVRSLGELMQQLCTGLEGAGGGGHSQAAGAMVREADVPTFVARYKEAMRM